MNNKKSDIRVLTYNILANSNVFHFLFKDHNETLLDAKRRLNLVIKEINELSPDIIFL